MQKYHNTLVALGPLILDIGLGMISGYSAILLPQLQAEKNSTIVIDDEQASWIASMAALPMATGCILGGVLIEKIGRKHTHMLTCLPTLLGWLLIAFACNTRMILGGRFITGLCVGILGAATSVYIGETSKPKYRGFLLAGISFAVSLGLFLSHLLGTFLHWKTTALVCSIVPIISLLLMIFTPESPSWLAKKGQLTKAEKAFYWCRGYSDEAKKELAVMLEGYQDKEPNLKMQIRDFLVPEFLKPLGIITVYIIANQWAGVNAITFYTVSIMKKTVGEGVNEYLSMLIVDVIRVVMSILACILLRRLGRRPLAVVSGLGTFMSLFTLSVFTYLVTIYPAVSSMVYIPMTALVIYISFISIGFVPLPWAMIGEVFPLKTRSIGSGITSFLAFTAFFSVVKTSPAMFRDLGAEGSFLVYGLVAFFGTIFVWIYLPETKGKPLHEIEDQFKSKREIKCVNNNSIVPKE
ncbi:facilitated trehalose transporter Tret1-2 homolog isoform X2 [Anoplophora glabripennis]|uniref:facilitated trehalose transporter Tret1-2 homolog isoform X2 n=1 Tax=Anoplophora glabripennis TaxID=217634 RepID=UPI000873CB69|nr:facilitated trehalose transporter Tret1-2 homolog isoform X2 [Anoplophora glabripennis]